MTLSEARELARKHNMYIVSLPHKHILYRRNPATPKRGTHVATSRTDDGIIGATKRACRSEG